MKSDTAKETEEVELISIANTVRFYSATTSILDYHMLTFRNLSDRGYEVLSDVLLPDAEPGGSKDEAEFGDIQELLCEYFGGTTQLEDIYILEKEKDTHVWIVISDDDEELRDSIYDAQYKLLNEHPYLRLDFYVVPIEGGSLESIVPTNALRLAGKVAQNCRP